MKDLLFCLFAICMLSGCATPQRLANSGATARLATSLSSDSVGTTGKFWRVLKFNDETCTADEKGTLVARKLTGNSGGALESVVLPAGERITLGFGYMESRFAQNRECSYSVTFTPKEHENYTANFAVSDNSYACNLSLTDSTGRSVETSHPTKSCVVGLLGRINNGQPGVLNWKIKVNVQRFP